MECKATVPPSSAAKASGAAATNVEAASFYPYLSPTRSANQHARPSGSKSSLVHQPATHHIRDRVTDRLLGAYPQPKYLRCTQHPRWDHTDRNGWSYHSIRLQTVCSERE